MQCLVAQLGALSVRPKQGVALSQRAALAATPVSLSSARRQSVGISAQRLVVRAAVTEVRER